MAFDEFVAVVIVCLLLRWCRVAVGVADLLQGCCRVTVGGIVGWKIAGGLLKVLLQICCRVGRGLLKVLLQICWGLVEGCCRS